MRILLVHNHYGSYSGETSVVEAQEALLRKNGHEIMRYTRSSVELETMPFGKTRAFFTGLYNPFSVREIERVLKEFRPDVALVGMLEGERFRRFYDQAALFLLSSICYEGFPMVILEAMNHALPVVAPRLGGLPEIIDDGVCGRLYEAGNCEDLVKILASLWPDSENMRRMGTAAHRKLAENYLPAIHYRKLAALYGRLTNAVREEQGD